MDTIKAACVQAAPVFLDLRATLDKTEALVREAADKGAKLVAFPETWLPGYPWWIWLGAPIEGMGFVPRYHANSIALESLEMARLQEIAADSAVTLVTGFSERDGGSLYMSQAIIGPEGDPLLVRRKLKPTHVERAVFGEGDGSGLTVVDAPFGRLGALNCWEHIQPLVKMALYAQGEEVHVASWPSFCLYRDVAYAFGPEVNNGASMLYAVEGGCYVLASSALISQQMIDMLCDRPEKAKLLSPLTGKPGGGFSMIYGPDGRPLCSPLPEDQEGILYADLDSAHITIAKSAADPVGHYSRPDVVRLVVNKTRRKVMSVVGEDASSPMMPPESMKTDIPSLNRLREATARKGAVAFRVGIVVGPGYFPLDMVGVQAVLGTMPGAEIYLVWKSREPVEGFRSWWTIPTATFSDCPDLDVVAVPMMPPEVQNDREVVNFVATRGRTARYVIGVCNGVLTLGAAGLLRGKRATVSHNSHSILPLYGVTEVVVDQGVVADGNVYTAGPGIGSFEAALLVAAQAFGRPAAQLAEFLIEYNPHPPFGTGTAAGAGPALVARFEGMMADMISLYRTEASKVAAGA